MPDSNKKWEILGREPVFQHPQMTLFLEKIRLPDGKIIPDWPHVAVKDYVNVLAMKNDGQFLIAKRYEHGGRRYAWQLVGDTLEEGEAPLDGGRRCLFVETGLECQNWYYLGSFVNDPQRYGGVGHLFFAHGVTVKEERLDDTWCWIGLDELQQGVLDGRISAMSYALTISLALLACHQKRIAGQF
ncbi:MAG: NUDIX hydrolase [Chloroflexi bacterium]|nr:MAG: NUDIX hydrolase [Chloroflexota bacterium]